MRNFIKEDIYTMPWIREKKSCTSSRGKELHAQKNCGYIVMLRARMFRSLIIRTGIKERNIRARNITI